MRRIELNLNNMKNEQELHIFLKEQLAFPQHYGENLDALHDMLTELSENVCLNITCCTNADSPIYKFGKKLERVMEDAAQTIDYPEDGKMFAVFADYETLDLGSW